MDDLPIPAFCLDLPDLYIAYFLTDERSRTAKRVYFLLKVRCRYDLAQLVLRTLGFVYYCDTCKREVNRQPSEAGIWYRNLDGGTQAYLS